MEKYFEGQNEMQLRTNTEKHLSDYVEIILRRKWILFLFIIIVVGSVSLFSVLATPTYQASAQIRLGEQPTPMNPLGSTSQRLPEITLHYQTQINLLKSRSLANTVIKNINMTDTTPEFGKKYILSSLLDSFAKIKNIIIHDQETDLAETEYDQPSKDIISESDERIAYSKTLNWYLNSLEIVPIRNSSLVDINFLGTDPVLITQIVNKHAETAIQNTINMHRSQAKNALGWLKEQISIQKQQVEGAQRAIYDFKKHNNVLSLEDSQIIRSQELQELNSALTREKSERIRKEALYRKLQELSKNKMDAVLLPQIAGDPVIQSLRRNLVDLQSQQIELSTKFGPKHPKMKELRKGILQTQKNIRDEINQQISIIKNDLDTTLAIEQSLQKSLEQQKEFAMGLGEKAIEYDVLKQEAESSQDIYDFLLKQSEELTLSSAISSSNMHIVDYANVPLKPIRPNLSLNVLLALCLSLFGGIGFSLFVDYLDNTVKTQLDIAFKLRLPVLGMIPLQKSLKHLKYGIPLLTDSIPDPNQEALAPIYHISNRLPDKLSSSTDGLFGRVLMVESVTLGEGKTTVISQIATNLMDAGLRVLLIDCDFQRPSLDKFFKVSSDRGLGKVIDRITSIELTTGDLTEYSIGDLFFVISLKKKTGRLIIKKDDQQLIAYFHNGALIHIQNPGSPESNRIGSMLLKGGFITHEQLNDALDRHHRTGHPMGYILVNAGYIGRDKLQGPLHLQIEEYVQKMFSWKHGEFVFKPGVASYYDNEKIYFVEDYSPMINHLSSIEMNHFIEKELFSNLHTIRKDSLYLLPSGSAYRLIGSMNQILMKKIFEKLRRHFDVMLVDTPPLDAASGIEALYPLTDGIVVVVKAGHLSIKVLNSALSHLPQDKIIGTVLNQVKTSTNTYY